MNQTRAWLRDSQALAFLLYRYRFLVTYVLIGLLSLCVEIVTFRTLARIGVVYWGASGLGIIAGIILACWGNLRFNFKIPRGKRYRATAYFVLISICSWGLQFLLRQQVSAWDWSYERARVFFSGGCFIVAYVFHRRWSFSDFKKVGVAVYANGIEDIRLIHRRIGKFADIIHVDIVDSTYGAQERDVRTYRIEVVRAYWPDKPIHAHLMTRCPTQYLRDLYPHVDRIYVHAETDESIEDVFMSIREAGREVGLAVQLTTRLQDIRGHVPHIDGILFLAIAQAGYSGQVFEHETLDRIAEFNKWPERAHVDVCVDGGVTEANVGLLNAEIVVSGSSVLRHPDPRRQIMRLQTSSRYEQTTRV